MLDIPNYSLSLSAFSQSLLHLPFPPLYLCKFNPYIYYIPILEHHRKKTITIWFTYSIILLFEQIGFHIKKQSLSSVNFSLHEYQHPSLNLLFSPYYNINLCQYSSRKLTTQLNFSIFVLLLSIFIPWLFLIN